MALLLAGLCLQMEMSVKDELLINNGGDMELILKGWGYRREVRGPS